MKVARAENRAGVFTELIIAPPSIESTHDSLETPTEWYKQTSIIQQDKQVWFLIVLEKTL